MRECARLSLKADGLTLVQLEDGVGHGGKSPLALQDVDVPDPESESEGSLGGQKKRATLYTGWAPPLPEAACAFCQSAHSVQEALEEPLHGVQAGENLLAVLQETQPVSKARTRLAVDFILREWALAKLKFWESNFSPGDA